ncbi:MAG: secondary thiamine-phosphate synthase enzyme YjbQ [Lachnospirales bacterium]
MNLYSFTLSTGKEDFYNITSMVNDAVSMSSVKDGICVIYTPHTTAAITINENADPDVVKDLIFAYNKIMPDMPQFEHAEGNSAAHLKSSLTGCSETVIVQNGKLLLGTWQGIYFCEFDGPRTRKFYVKLLG